MTQSGRVTCKLLRIGVGMRFLMKGLQALLVLLTLALSGCTTTESVMDSWVGYHIDEVTAAWGAPSGQIARSDGGHTYSWETTSGNTYGVSTCTQSFVTDAEGYVRTWSYNNCPGAF